MDDKLITIQSDIGELKKNVAALQRTSKALKRSISNMQPVAGQASTKKPKKLNAYMFWCNYFNGGARKPVAAEIKEETGSDPDMRTIATKLGAKWKALPAAVKDKLKILCDDHNKQLQHEVDSV